MLHKHVFAVSLIKNKSLYRTLKDTCIQAIGKWYMLSVHIFTNPYRYFQFVFICLCVNTIPASLYLFSKRQIWKLITDHALLPQTLSFCFFSAYVITFLCLFPNYQAATQISCEKTRSTAAYQHEGPILFTLFKILFLQYFLIFLLLSSFCEPPSTHPSFHIPHPCLFQPPSLPLPLSAFLGEWVESSMGMWEPSRAGGLPHTRTQSICKPGTPYRPLRSWSLQSPGGGCLVVWGPSKGWNVHFVPPLLIF